MCYENLTFVKMIIISHENENMNFYSLKSFAKLTTFLNISAFTGSGKWDSDKQNRKLEKISRYSVSYSYKELKVRLLTTGYSGVTIGD